MINYNFVSRDDGPKDPEERKRQRKERARIEKEERERNREQEIQDFIYPYEHPIPELVRRKIAKIEIIRKSKREHITRNPNWNKWCMNKEQILFIGSVFLPPEHSQSVYILDKEMNIIDWVEAKRKVGLWLRRSKKFNKGYGRTLLYGYIKNRALYKDTFYFVPVKEYEDFMKEKS
ncbi:hypothetical protein COL48_08785 [Bacillus toyonensis]|uniref:hypothetical protein n=1 Tax=Bacillus toyonensis TaxID=155322 RepID=UPI000BF7558D|nr:hypothetical protein [Bacillus toyonensis]PFY33388.1 hypothetical protein COL48_08785 [Bacillus toyonensis]PHB35375.1 hypothetical protein COE86_12500 [Bacillus toyonensis]QWI03701.1 hypothetical protein EXW54_02860 [Bacillus toyonensis]HDR7385741.1 hypothetical protein [Bacillus toyonensis]